VVKALQVTFVHSMMGVLGIVYQFFAAHPKCQWALEDAISSHQPACRVHKLKDMCRTRWQCLYPYVVLCLELIGTSGIQPQSRGLQVAQISCQN